MKNKLIVYILFRELSKRNRRRIRSPARYANCGISGRSINSSTPSTLSSSLPLSSPHLPHSISSASRGQFLVLHTCYQPITQVIFFLKRRFKTSRTALQSEKDSRSLLVVFFKCFLSKTTYLTFCRHNRLLDGQTPTS